MPIIERALPDHAGILTEIAISAKRHWNYPERWIEMWRPVLAISPEYISENETWMAIVERPVGFYSLVDTVIAGRALFPTKQSQSLCSTALPSLPLPRNDEDSLWLDNLWVLPEFMGQGMGRQLFQHALERSHTLHASKLKIEADPNAQSFYEKMGARKVGEHHSKIDDQPRILPIMEINL
jgi:GNAT superfamily N-acetyltransferase